MPENPIFASDERTVLLPIDHGTAIPVPDLYELDDLTSQVSPWVDGYVLNYGMARRFGYLFEGKRRCLRTDVYQPSLRGGSIRVFGPDEAEECGAGSMMQMLYPGHENEEDLLRECAELIAEGEEAGLPVIVEALPVGLGQTDAYTPEAIEFAVRQAGELGAVVVKTAFPTGGTESDFAQIVRASLVPVIVLGGAASTDDRGLLETVAKAMQAGASGVAIGRNVWQHEAPGRMARMLHGLVHEGSTVDAVMEASET